MYFDFSELAGRDVYKLMTSTVVPRPIAWVVSRNAQGRLNAAPFSFFGLMSGEPPVICIGVGSRAGEPKDTSVNLSASRDFVVNLVPACLLHAMNVTAIDFHSEVDELLEAGLETLPGQRIDVPRIARSPVALECTVMQMIEVAQNRRIFVASVLGAHIADDAVIDAQKCYIDTLQLDLVARLQSGGGYSVQQPLPKVPAISVEQWQAKRGAAAP